MSMHRRTSVPRALKSPTVQVNDADTELWVKSWSTVYARDLIDSPIISISGDASVEEACDLLLYRNIPCVAVESARIRAAESRYVGLFDYADVNAFLTLAATRHTLQPDDLKGKHKLEAIVNAAREGIVPLRLVSNLSEKNPLETVPFDATVLSLLQLFARGYHRILVQSADAPNTYIGVVSDRSLLSWFHSQCQGNPPLLEYIANPICSLALPSLNLYSAVVAANSSWTVLDAMKLMSDQGVSSIAVLDDEGGRLLSAVSVTDIGKLVVPSQSNQVLSTPLKHFISQIKEPDGSTDGVDKFPVYSVQPHSTLAYTMEKLLATNAHRLFTTHDQSPFTLSGIVSIVDILSLFARIGNIPDVDPQRMRHRRASSVASSRSSTSDHNIERSRSGTRHSPSISQSPRTSLVFPKQNGAGDAAMKRRSLGSGVDLAQWAERVSRER